MNDGRLPDIGIGSDNSAAESASKPDKDRRVGLLVALAIVVVALVALIASTMGDDKASDSGVDDAVPEPAALVATPDVEADRVGDVDTNTARTGNVPGAGSASGIPPSADHLRSEDVARAFADELDSPTVRYGIAYVGPSGFTVLDARGIEMPELAMAQTFEQVTEYALLTADGRTWAVNAGDRDRSYLVSNMYVVVESERASTIAVVDIDSLISVGLFSSGLPIPGVDVPPGADVIVVQGRGLLVLPRTGGTFEIRGIASSLERLSDDRAVAASLGATAYERCDEELRCELILETDAHEFDVSLPVDPRARLHLSPSGRFVVAVESGRTVLYDAQLDQSLALLDQEIDAIGWAPDDRFVAVAIGGTIEIRYPTGEPTVTLELNEVPDLASLLVFSSTTP